MRGLREHSICRLCLSTGCRLIDILEESRNDEFVVKQAVEDLLHLVVLKEALYPWLVCSICLEKLREFHFFKRRCVENQEVYDSRIRGNIWPVKQVRSTECDNIAVKTEEVASTWESLVIDSKNPNDGSLFEVSQSAIGHDRDIDIPIKSEGDNAVEDPLQHDTCKNVNSDCSSQPSSEGLSIDYKVSVKVEQSDKEDNVKEDETFLSEDGDSREPEAGYLTIHGMKVESSRIEQDGPGNCVSDKGQEAISMQDAMSRYTTIPFLAEESNTNSNAVPIQFSQSGQLSSHMSSRDGTRPVECQLCRKKFSPSSYLIRHLEIHDGERLFECEECHKKFSESGNLSKHMRTHDGKRPFECEVCNKKFPRKETLIHHMRIHDGKRPFECEVCKKKFSHSGNRNSHMRTHDGKRPFECERCNKKFTQINNLSRHMRTHEGKEPFECELCNKKFSRRGNLNTHMRTHDGKRPFECELCNKKFSLKGNLRRHVKTHNGNRPFECEVCKKKFSQSDHLRFHMMTHD